MLSRGPSNNSAQLAATALVSGIIVASAILGYQRIRRERNVERLKHSIPDLDEEHTAERLNEFGAVEASLHWSTEDERSAALAARALDGDYDDGKLHYSPTCAWQEEEADQS
jgi:hypothetical protein